MRSASRVFAGTSLAVLIVVFSPSAGAQPVEFVTGVNFAAGSLPQAVATGDFNRSGDPDIVVANAGGSTISSFLGNGTGGFAVPATFAVGSNPHGIVAADFTGDTRSDFATANFGSGNVTILVSAGYPTFNPSAGSPFSVGTNPEALAAADFDNDTRLDLVVANGGSANVSVLRGLGAGNFGAAVNFAVGSGPRAIVTGDFNRDGQQDFAVANSTSGTVSVMLGNGALSFTPAPGSPLLVGLDPRGLAVADFNRDGRLDLVTANTGSADLDLLLGNGSGGFSGGGVFAAGNTPESVVAADFNDDGRLDVAVANSSLNTMSVLAGNLAGFGAPVSFATASIPLAAAVADFDRDGRPDLGVAASGSDVFTALISVSSTSQGSCFAAALNTAIDTNSRGLEVADFDRDGNLDYAVTSLGSGYFNVYLGDGSGNFTLVSSWSGFNPYGLDSGDLDHDGVLDVIITDPFNDLIAIFQGIGDGTFSFSGFYFPGTVAFPTSVVTGDLNEDGNLDVVVAGEASNDAWAVLGTGTLSFYSSTRFVTGPQPVHVALPDLNRDGNLDLVTANFGTNLLSVRLGDGLGGFGARVDHSVGTSPGWVATADVNRDGNSDLVVSNYGSADITVKYGDGAGGFFFTNSFFTGAGPSSAGVADVNSNGTLDVVTTNFDDDNATVLLGNGGSGFALSGTPALGISPRAIGMGDFNHDGKPDFAAINQNGTTLSTVLSTPGAASFSLSAPSSVAAGAAFSVTVTALDACGNVATSYAGTVHFTSSDGAAVLPADTTFSAGDNGVKIVSVTLQTLGSQTVVATDTVTGTITGSVPMTVRQFSKLQILLPGETAAPGTPSGKTGTATAQIAGTAFIATVNAVDPNWYLITAVTDTAGITASDPNATLPASAALVGGTRNFSVTARTVGAWTVTATDITNGGVAPDTSSSFSVNPGAFTKLQILVPGETAAPGSASGKTGTPTAATAGAAFPVTVNAVDANWNRVPTVADTVGITASDVNAVMPANAALIAGTQTFNVTLVTGGARTVTATNISDGTKASSTSPAITVVAGSFVGLQILVPGETAAPGTAAGKTGTPTTRVVDALFSISVNAVDLYWNRVTTVTDTVAITSTDTAAVLPANQALVAGTRIYSSAVRLMTVGTWTLTASDLTDGGKTPNTSPGILAVVGPFTRLQILAPGETPAPGSASGKTGTPAPQTAGVPFPVTVNAVDANWYLVNSVTDTVGITSSDVNAVLPVNAALVAGTQSFSVTLKTGGGRTVTATDITDPAKIAGLSASISVIPNAFTKLQILVPGETAAPGSDSGKTGAPTARTAGTAFTVTVNAVDDYWNKVTTITDTVSITSTDGAAILPANQALAAGTRVYTNGVTLRTAGTWTLTASDLTDGGKTPNTSPDILVSLGPFFKLQLLVPGEFAAPGTASGKTGTPAPQVAGVPFAVTVNAVDSNWYLINTVTDTVGITSSDANAILPANAALIAGTQNFGMTLRTAGARTITATDITDGTKLASTSPSIAVAANAFTKLQLLVPGETAAPGSTSGKTGAPTARNAGSAFSVTVNAVDDCWNVVVSVTDTVGITSSDATAVLPANQALAAGTRTFTNGVTLRTVGNWTVTATDITDGGKTPNTSPDIPVILGPFSKLQILAPGETAAPGTASGKTGTPASQMAGVAFSVTVNAVDSNWYLINTVSDTVGITSSDANAILPANAALAGGTQNFSVTLRAGGGQTVTATDISDGTKTASTSSSIPVSPNAFTKLQLLVPGETAAPGSATGKTGTPSAEIASAAFSVTVSAVDDYWNRVTTVTDTAGITSTDGTALLPGNAALVAGTRAFSVTFNTAPGPWTITATDISDGSKPADTSPLITVTTGVFTKLQILVPGETGAPGSPTGKTGTPIGQTAGVPFDIVVNAVNANWYVIGSVTDTVHFTSTDANAILPADTPLVGGTLILSVTLRTNGARTLTVSDITDGSKTANTSASITVALNAFVGLQILVPGETVAPGSIAGKTGSPTPRNAGALFSITVNAVDMCWNRITTITHTVAITSTDAAAILPGNLALVAGTRTYTNAVEFRTPGTWTLTASNVTDATKTPNTSPDISVITGPFNKLQILAPGETAAPGTTTGKTGTPSSQIAGAPFAVTVYAVDANWYLMNTVTDVVGITSSDTNAMLPSNTALVAGTQNFNVTLKTGGGRTVTATDITDGTKTANTSASITVIPDVFVKLQILVPGETAAPGTGSGKTGAPTARLAGAPFNITVNAVDVNWNRVTTVTDTVAITSTDPIAVLPANQALAAGTRTYTNGVELRTVGTFTLTATDFTDGTKLPNTSPGIPVTIGPFTKLQILAPGETAAPGTVSGKVGTPDGQTAGLPFAVTVNAVDANWYVVGTVNDTVAITSSDANAFLPPNAALTGGTGSFNVTLKTGGGRTVTATDFSDGSKTPITSASITVNPNVFTKLQILVPGETAAPGSLSGKTGVPTARTAGTAFTVTVNAVDDYWNKVTTVVDTVAITSTDAAAVLPANQALALGTRVYTNAVTLRTVGTWTLTANDVSDGAKTPNTSPDITVVLGPFSKLQILAPGETEAPGTASGKTGTPTAQVAGVPFMVKVNAVDSNWYLINTVTDTIGITSSDANATLPGDAALVAGTQMFNITLRTGGGRTVTATDISDGTKTANTSSSITVLTSAFTKLQILVPGETAAPGSVSGKTGVPTARRAGTAFTVTVNAVDDYWNKVTSVTDTVSITSNDPLSVLPANQALALGTRTYTNAVTLRSVGNYTLTATDVTDAGKTPNTSPDIPVTLGPFVKLQLLVPGETPNPGTTSGKTGTPTPRTANVPFPVTVNAVDSNWYVIDTVTDTANITSSDANAVLPPNAALVAGTQTFSVALNTVGTRTITARDITDATKTSNTSPSITVIAGAFVKMQILAPGETAAPGTDLGKTGTPNVRTAGTSFSVTLNACDAVWNRVTAITDSIALSSSDSYATLPASNVLIAGTRTLSLTFRTAGTATVTVTDLSDGSKTPDTTPPITVVPGVFSKLQILVPGETAEPGSTSGKLGTPTPQSAGAAFIVTVNGVDANWNRVTTVADTVAITSTDASATLPPNAALSSGTQTFSVTLNSTGSWTVTATDTSDGTKTASTSPAINAGAGSFTKLQILVPGETAAPGTPSGKTGTPSTFAAGTPFAITVNAVDALWNRNNGVSDTVRITSSDGGAVLPADTPLVAGTVILNVTFSQAGTFTVTASDMTDGGKTPNTSPGITVIGETAGTVGNELVWSGASEDSLQWGAALNAQTYRLYEGVRADLPNLLTSTNDSCLRWTGAATTTGNVLTQTPAAGEFSWFLIVGVNTGVEGGSGNATAGARILNSTGACP